MPTAHSRYEFITTNGPVTAKRHRASVFLNLWLSQFSPFLSFLAQILLVASRCGREGNVYQTYLERDIKSIELLGL